MLTKKQAFKVGFLRKCANAGMTPQETHEVVKEALVTVKEAAIPDIISKPIGYVADLARDVTKPIAGGLGTAGLAALLLGPPAIGGSLGWLASKAGDIDDTDVDTVKKREIIDEYRRQTERLRRKRKSI